MPDRMPDRRPDRMMPLMMGAGILAAGCIVLSVPILSVFSHPSGSHEIGVVMHRIWLLLGLIGLAAIICAWHAFSQGRHLWDRDDDQRYPPSSTRTLLRGFGVLVLFSTTLFLAIGIGTSLASGLLLSRIPWAMRSGPIRLSPQDIGAGRLSSGWVELASCPVDMGSARLVARPPARNNDVRVVARLYPVTEVQAGGKTGPTLILVSTRPEVLRTFMRHRKPERGASPPQDQPVLETISGWLQSSPADEDRKPVREVSGSELAPVYLVYEDLIRHWWHGPLLVLMTLFFGWGCVKGRTIITLFCLFSLMGRIDIRRKADLLAGREN